MKVYTKQKQTHRKTYSYQRGKEKDEVQITIMGINRHKLVYIIYLSNRIYYIGDYTHYL